MDNSTYSTLTRQTGLMREMQAVANNIANMSTTGFRQEGLIFAEHIAALDDQPSLSMASATARETNQLQGSLKQTNGTFDFAIEGDGFFLLDTPNGERLTRAGSFMVSPEGELVNPDGNLVLDAGGAPIFIPPNAEQLGVGADGTISLDGQPLGQLGIYLPEDPASMQRQDGVMFETTENLVPATGAILQGFVEASNVNPVLEISRMIEIQRAYEMGQGFLDKEDERIRNAMQTLTR